MRLLSGNYKRCFKIIKFQSDCEGAEYEIIPNLIKHDILGKIDVVVMETHYGGEDGMIDAFRKEGFIVYSNQEAPFRTGTLFAVRQNRAG